jgi:hypothetical protein
MSVRGQLECANRVGCQWAAPNRGVENTVAVFEALGGAFGSALATGGEPQQQ